MRNHNKTKKPSKKPTHVCLGCHRQFEYKIIEVKACPVCSGDIVPIDVLEPKVHTF